AMGLDDAREDNGSDRSTAEGLMPAGAKEPKTTDTILLGKNAIHAVTNPLRQFTGAIHAYGGDFFGVPRSEWDPKTLEERPYDVERAKRQFKEANERWKSESAESAAGRRSGPRESC